jgi:hypothetical protein
VAINPITVAHPAELEDAVGMEPTSAAVLANLHALLPDSSLSGWEAAAIRGDMCRPASDIQVLHKRTQVIRRAVEARPGPPGVSWWLVMAPTSTPPHRQPSLMLRRAN